MTLKMNFRYISKIGYKYNEDLFQGFKGYKQANLVSKFNFHFNYIKLPNKELKVN